MDAHRVHSRWSIAVFACLAVSASALRAADIVGGVVGVADGDTITVLDAGHHQHKVRFSGIDAPEKGQPFGQASKRHLAALVVDREVVAECSKTDRYGRLGCRVMIDGADAGLAQLRAGMAWYFTRYSSELPSERRSEYADAEAQAKAGRVDLWVQLDALAPRDWRRLEADRSATRWSR